MNTVNLIGRLTEDPAGRVAGTGKDGVRVLNFTVAVNRIGSEDADFIRCVAFGKTADFIEDYFEKGVRIGVTGRIQTGHYEREDGTTVWTTDVIVERADFADGKKDDGRSQRSQKDDGRSQRSQKGGRR